MVAVCLIAANSRTNKNFCQVFLTKENSPGTSNDGVLLAVGGRYDYLVQEVCDREYVSSFHIFSSCMERIRICSINYDY